MMVMMKVIRLMMSGMSNKHLNILILINQEFFIYDIFNMNENKY